MKLILTIALLLLPSFATAEERWSCIATAAVGFAYDARAEKWKAGPIEVFDRPFIVIRKRNPADPDTWVFSIGWTGDTPGRPCYQLTDDSGKQVDYEFICVRKYFDFRLNLETLDYTRAHINSSKTSTPFIETGKCKPY